MDIDSLPQSPEARAMAQKWQQEAQAAEQASNEMAGMEMIPAEQQISRSEEMVENQTSSADKMVENQTPPTEDIGARNFRALQESKRRVERERDEAVALAQQFMSEKGNKQQGKKK